MAIRARNEVQTSDPPETPCTSTHHFFWQHRTARSQLSISASWSCAFTCSADGTDPSAGVQRTEPGSSPQRLSHGAVDTCPKNLLFSLGLSIARVQAEAEVQRARKRLFESGNKRDTVEMNLLAWCY